MTPRDRRRTGCPPAATSTPTPTLTWPTAAAWICPTWRSCWPTTVRECKSEGRPTAAEAEELWSTAFACTAPLIALLAVDGMTSGTAYTGSDLDCNDDADVWLEWAGEYNAEVGKLVVEDAEPRHHFVRGAVFEREVVAAGFERVDIDRARIIPAVAAASVDAALVNSKTMM